MVAIDLQKVLEAPDAVHVVVPRAVPAVGALSRQVQMGGDVPVPVEALEFVRLQRGAVWQRDEKIERKRYRNIRDSPTRGIRRISMQASIDKRARTETYRVKARLELLVGERLANVLGGNRSRLGEGDPKVGAELPPSPAPEMPGRQRRGIFRLLLFLLLRWRLRPCLGLCLVLVLGEEEAGGRHCGDDRVDGRLAEGGGVFNARVVIPRLAAGEKTRRGGP
jgi:hypothetical protein